MLKSAFIMPACARCSESTISNDSLGLWLHHSPPPRMSMVSGMRICLKYSWQQRGGKPAAGL